MADALLTEMLKLATQLACDAGEVALKYAGNAAAERKYDQSVVTGVDHAIQAHIAEKIGKEFPDHTIVGEESSAKSAVEPIPPDRRFCWIIDPIDGTRNYVASFPCFATSIAVVDNGTPVVAVVREHNTNRLVSAVTGCGTTLNDKPVKLNDSIALTDAIVGVPSSKERFTVSVVQCLAATKKIVLRDVGATAVHLALVASGALAGAFCQRAKLWDVAAGSLLVTEAGGRITGAFGEPFFPLRLDGEHDRNIPFLAGTDEVHAQLLKLIAPLRDAI